jgi:hypothetical protein
VRVRCFERRALKPLTTTTNPNASLLSEGGADGRAVVERAAASLTQPHLRVLTAEVQGLDVARRRLRTSAGEVCRLTQVSAQGPGSVRASTQSELRLAEVETPYTYARRLASVLSGISRTNNQLARLPGALRQAVRGHGGVAARRREP